MKHDRLSTVARIIMMNYSNHEEDPSYEIDVSVVYLCLNGIAEKGFGETSLHYEPDGSLSLHTHAL